MTTRKDQDIPDRVLNLIDRHWLWLVFLTWLGFCAWYVFDRWGPIQQFALRDTDDNMRLAQVRALLHGQGWFDLRQYRLNPPFGANIHWSRIVDLPIAGLILAFRPMLGGAGAERWAVAIAPLLPLLLLLVSLALTCRRLIHPAAWPLAFVALFFAGSANGMFQPERIDHHGWQLALMALAIAGVADPRRRRGGVILGIASALSLAIGLEMLIYLAILGVAMALFWVVDRDEKDRLATYGLALGGGTAAGFLAFASYANRGPVCDALSPVWLSDALLGGALLFGLSRIKVDDWKRRLALALAAGVVLAAFHALAWPHCLQRLEGVSDEANRLWLSHVREARPIYRHGWRVALASASLPAVGAIGWMILGYLKRGDPPLLRRVIAAGAPAVAAAVLLLWQTRTGPAAQAMAVTGAAALGWTIIPWFWKHRAWPLQTIGAALAVLICAGAIVPLTMRVFPSPPKDERGRAIDRANYLCGTIWGLRPIAQLPRGRMMTFVDIGPRLIVLTHHDAVTGPYHRNYPQIVDVMKFWRGSADEAHAIARKYRSNYVLSCPKSSTSTIFQSEAPRGFYVQLENGQVPGWLSPIPLPEGSPFKAWRVTG